MRAVLMTYDPVQLSFATALLTDANIATVVLDASASVIEALAGKPAQRLMVEDKDFARAQAILRDGMKDAPVES